jgi:hypothetical protein
VLPASLAAVGAAGVGASLFVWFASYRVLLTLAALLALAGGWVMWWRARNGCRTGACAPPSRITTALLTLSTALFIVTLAWAPLLEPLALKGLLRWRH